jgi:hypothetical protein
MHSKTSRERFAELTSSLGAGILGAGIGSVGHRYLGSIGIPLLVLGLGMHGFGMWDMRRMERAGVLAPRPLWSLILYGLCWLCLLGIAVYLIAGKA